MDEQKMRQTMSIIGDMVTENLDDLELAVLNNAAQLDMDPRGRLFDYDKVKSLFDVVETNGMPRMHEETKIALAVVVNRRLASGRKVE